MAETSITPADEELHEIEYKDHWQESWYFNFADPSHNLFGLTRIGFNFKARKIDGLVLTIRNGQPDYIYPAVNIPFKKDWASQQASKGITAKNLAYKAEDPLKKWRLTLTGKDSMDLEWTPFTPPFDYHASLRDLPPDVTGRHFEQSGKVSGTINFKGVTLEIDGTGQRDKSWGVRDWANIEGWNWISAQFGQDLSYNIWEGFYNGERYENGFVFDEGENYPVNHLTISFEWDKKTHIPRTAAIVIQYGPDKQLNVTATSLGHFPLIKKGLWIQETHSTFVADKDGTKIDGIGVIEHAWHAEKMEILKRIPSIIKTFLNVYF